MGEELAGSLAALESASSGLDSGPGASTCESHCVWSLQPPVPTPPPTLPWLVGEHEGPQRGHLVGVGCCSQEVVLLS